jgi:putative transposase
MRALTGLRNLIYQIVTAAFQSVKPNAAEIGLHLVRRTALVESIAALDTKPVLHGDNGSTLKATTVLTMLHWLGVKPSYSQPCVSNDNAYAESLFRTAKYRPEFPAKGFSRLDEARQGPGLLNSCIGTTAITTTAASATSARSNGTLATTRAAWRLGTSLYLQAMQRNPARWSRNMLDWSHIGAVTLSQKRDAILNLAAGTQHTQQKAA